jgi:hypothetical protein
MTDLEKICEAERLLRSVRDNHEPDPFCDLDSAIAFGRPHDPPRPQS